MLYSSAVSMRFMPASRAALTIRLTSPPSHRAPKKSVPKLLPPRPTMETSRLPIRRRLTPNAPRSRRSPLVQLGQELPSGVHAPAEPVVGTDTSVGLRAQGHFQSDH